MIYDGLVRVERSITDDLSGNIESNVAILDRQLRIDFGPVRETAIGRFCWKSRMWFSRQKSTRM